MKHQFQKLTALLLSMAIALSCTAGLTSTALAVSLDTVQTEQVNNADTSVEAEGTAEATSESSAEVEEAESEDVENSVLPEAENESAVPTASETEGLDDQPGWYYGEGWEYNYSGAANSTVTQENGLLKATVDYSADADRDYSKMAVCYYTDNAMSWNQLNKITLDFYYDEINMTTGGFKLNVYSNGGINTEQTLDLTSAETVTGTLKKLPVEISFNATTADANDIAFCLIGVNTDYKGDVWLDNIQTYEASAQQPEKNEDTVAFWDFEDGIDGWYYDSNWSNIGEKGSVEAENGMLKFSIDYSEQGDNSWAQEAVSIWNNDGMNLSGANRMTADLIFEQSKLDGGLNLKVYSGDANVDEYITVDTENVEELGNGKVKASVAVDFSEVEASSVQGWTIALIGNCTTYSGAFWIDNVAILTVTDPGAEDIYVDATLTADDKTEIWVDGSNLVTYDKNGNVERTSIDTGIQLADGQADENTKQLYAYLKALGESGSVLFGHQNDTWKKAGSANLSCSDTLDVTGSISGVIGMDTLSLVGDEYSVSDYNAQFGKDMEDSIANRVKAAAELTNWNIEQGAIITLSSHMPNFSTVSERECGTNEPTYAAYDFSGYTPNVLTGDVANQILPGGQYNTKFNAYLDMIADYASQVKGTVLFRPFHENTGSWFWWGAAFCDAETYKNIYRYTVEYLRDEKQIHNLIYVYGPGSEAATLEEYESRYPGDAYVDMVGFDMYHSSPKEGDGWLEKFRTELELVDTFADNHGKLIAVTETGVANDTVAGDSQTALLKTGNDYLDWYNQMLDIISETNASYFLTWANFAIKSGFYTPYVVSVNENGVLHGHEMLDYFIDFFNDPRSIFASNQKAVLSSTIADIDAEAAASVTGYFTSPIAGQRILEETTFTARITGASEDTKVQMVFVGADSTITLDASTIDGIYYDALLTNENLAALGESAAGTVELLIDGQSMAKQSEIFGIPEPEKDPYLIDNFEDYYGVDSMLTKYWTTNKATGSTITLNLTNADGESKSGYGMKFTYSEQIGGWAGATISKEVDWSDCNALQFWTIPDENQQKVVIQLTANNICYEAYLNLYDAYAASAGKPTMVTIPFAEFCQRDTEGNPKGGLLDDCSTISSFGLWVNAIDNEAFGEDGYVNGSIWYDDITAVSSDVTEATFKSDENVTEPDTPTEPEDPDPVEPEPDKPVQKDPVQVIVSVVKSIVKTVWNLLKSIFGRR